MHALFVGAMLSALRVGTFTGRAAPDALLERAPPVSVVQAFISTSPTRLAAELPDQPLDLPASASPDLEPIAMPLALRDVEWGFKDASNAPLSAASRQGIADVRCEVHIHQDARGHVQAIDLGPCTENAAWQRSLLRAIVQAAALATPSSAVHPPELTLTVNTSRISAVLLARALSDPLSQSKGTPENIVTWRRQ